MSLFLSYFDQHFEGTCRVPLSILFLVSFYCTLRLLFITMALSTCLSHPRVFVKADQGILILRPRHKLNMEKRLTVSLDSSSRLFCQNNMGVGTNLGLGWSIVGGCKFAGRLNTDSLSLQKKRSGICSCCKSFQSNFIVLVHPLILMMNTIWSFYYVLCKAVGTQFASCAFTLGTVAVLPFYTLMLFAPTSEITKKTMASCIPYVVLGLVYVYLLYRSWTPDTIHLMFASKYWLPEVKVAYSRPPPGPRSKREPLWHWGIDVVVVVVVVVDQLPGIAKMFSNEMTLASAWIHLLVVDLFAARHVYQDGLKNDVETRHSVSLCLLTCPVGILSHTITKALINQKRNRD